MSDKLFRLSAEPVDPAELRASLADRSCGGYASFEGWVRDHNEGRRVTRLEYEAFEPLAVKEGERVLAEAVARFGVERVACVHRVGDLALGDMAVWVGVSARHRHEAFLACRYIIDEVKHRLPIWKKEHYQDGDSGWVNCERCAAAGTAAAGVQNEHDRLGHDHPGHDQPGHDHPGHDQPGHDHPAHEHIGHGHGMPALVPDYSRQMALKEVGARGQARLKGSRVLVVGAGGLGVPVLLYLAGAGVGQIDIVDGDRLEPSNLHRQTLYALADCGRLKAELAAERLHALNPEVDVRAHPLRFDAASGPALIESCDLAIDCTDNFATKFLLNDLAVRLGKPVILSSVYQFEGQLQVVRPERNGACLRCIWPEATRDGLVGNCAEAGVLGPVPGVFGTLQALEALKVLLDLPGQLGDELLMVDLLTHSVSRVRARRAAACSAGACVRLDPVEAAEERAPIELALDDLGAAIEQGFTLIDVREPHEVRAAPLPASPVREIPLHELIELILSEPVSGARALDTRGKYLLVCASGKRSLAGAQELRARGFESAYSLPGGLARLKQHQSA